jgi:hypothetical protein
VENHPRVEALKEMGPDIRREKGAEKPLYVLFQVKVKFKCSTLGTPIPFLLQKVKALGQMWGKRLFMVVP